MSHKEQNLIAAFLVLLFCVGGAGYYIWWFKHNWDSPREKQKRTIYVGCFVTSAFLGGLSLYYLVANLWLNH